MKLLTRLTVNACWPSKNGRQYLSGVNSCRNSLTGLLFGIFVFLRDRMFIFIERYPLLFVFFQRLFDLYYYEEYKRLLRRCKTIKDVLDCSTEHVDG